MPGQQMSAMPPAPPDVNNVVEGFIVIIGVLAAIGAALRGYFGKQPAPPVEKLTISGALMDNRAVDPLVEAINRNTRALEMFLTRLEGDDQKRRLREELERDHRIESLLEQLADAKGLK